MLNNFGMFESKMKREKLDKIVISAFGYLYNKLVSGETGKLSSTDIGKPDLDRLKEYHDLPDGSNAPWEKLAIIKLNGGLGTSMGLKRAKSLLKVKGDNNFLDIIANQIIGLRKGKKVNIPLIFMDSFNTSADTLEYLKKYDNLTVSGLPLDFLQNKFPKVRIDNYEPLESEDDKKTWNPPGHGEIYTVLKQRGILEQLISKGYRYVFISNSDNLGAVADARILQYMSQENIPFIMEVCHRTEMDKKGGHLASDKDGKLILRESAQCPQDEISQFQDVDYFKFFNTNNLWVDLHALSESMQKYNNYLPLTPIMNRKEVEGAQVIQLETAMGAAINIFDDSQAVVVGRERFVPVKKTNEFLAVRSDAYQLNDEWQILLDRNRNKAPQIDLDERFYKLISDFEKRFPVEYPSLKECESLSVKGNVYFGRNIELKGKIGLEAHKEYHLSDSILENEVVKL